MVEPGVPADGRDQARGEGKLEDSRRQLRAAPVGTAAGPAEPSERS